MKKKKIIIFVVIILFIILAGVLIFLRLNNKSEENTQNDTSWVELYVSTIAGALNGESDDFYYTDENISNLKIEILKSDNYETPFVILEYTENLEGIAYQGYDIFYLNGSNVDHKGVSYSGETTLMYLYNNESNSYGWYFYSVYDDLIVVESVDETITGESWSDPYGSEAQFNEVYTKIDDINSYSNISVNFNIDENELKTSLQDLALKFNESNENTLKLKEER